MTSWVNGRSRHNIEQTWFDTIASDVIDIVALSWSRNRPKRERFQKFRFLREKKPFAKTRHSLKSVGFWIPDVSGSHTVKTSPVRKWFRFWTPLWKHDILSLIFKWKPPLFCFCHWNTGQICQVFEWCRVFERLFYNPMYLMSGAQFSDHHFWQKGCWGLSASRSVWYSNPSVIRDHSKMTLHKLDSKSRRRIQVENCILRIPLKNFGEDLIPKCRIYRQNIS